MHHRSRAQQLARRATIVIARRPVSLMYVEGSMSAYVIVEVEVTDQLQYDAYRRLSGPSVAAYGGRFVVRGGAIDSLEGDWRPERIVVIEFENVAAARRWYDSPEYRAARNVRAGAANFRMIVVAGVEASPAAPATSGGP